MGYRSRMENTTRSSADGVPVSLEIEKSMLRDTGTFRCHAVNEDGEESTACELVVDESKSGIAVLSVLTQNEQLKMPFVLVRWG